MTLISTSTRSMYKGDTSTCSCTVYAPASTHGVSTACHNLDRPPALSFITDSSCKLASSFRHRATHIRLSFAMKLINTDWLDERFWAVSNPQSPDYGQYLSFDEIAKKVEPLTESSTCFEGKIKGFRPGIMVTLTHSLVISIWSNN